MPPETRMDAGFFRHVNSRDLEILNVRVRTGDAGAPRLGAYRRRFMRGGGVPPPATPSRRSLRSRTARAGARRCPCPATRAGRKSSRRSRPATGCTAAAIAGQPPATGCRSRSRPRCGLPPVGQAIQPASHKPDLWTDRQQHRPRGGNGLHPRPMARNRRPESFRYRIQSIQ